MSADLHTTALGDRIPVMFKRLFPLRDMAACKDESPEWFYAPMSENGWSQKHRNNVAKSICNRCAIMMECRKWAMKYEPYGTWGGMTEHERRRAKYGAKKTDVHLDVP